MRKSWVQDPKTGKLIPKEEYQRAADVDAPFVYGDISPYRSMIDGSIIGSRSTHRAHLRAHGCIEVGNEKVPTQKRKKAGGLKQELIRQFNR